MNVINFLQSSTTSTKLIAEMSTNHDGSIDKAKKLIFEAKLAGADYIKLQTYTAEKMTLKSDKHDFKVPENHALWGNKSLYEIYTEGETPKSWHSELFEFAAENEIEIFSTPFDIQAVDFLESLDVKMYKIASLENGDIALVKKIAQTGKPILASTGATEVAEIDYLVETILSEGNPNLTLMLCTSSYPTPDVDVALNRILFLRERYKLPVGFSDHSLGIDASMIAATMGVKYIEKHVKLSEDHGGLDAAFSITPAELATLSKFTRRLPTLLGDEIMSIKESEVHSRSLRRSLIVTKDVKRGQTINENCVASLRPNIGIEPKFLEKIIGKRFSQDITAGSGFSWDMLDID